VIAKGAIKQLQRCVLSKALDAAPPIQWKLTIVPFAALKHDLIHLMTLFHNPTPKLTSIPHTHTLTHTHTAALLCVCKYSPWV